MSDYTTLATFKDAIKFTDADRDDEFERAITAASRAFDRLTRREDNAFVSQTDARSFDGGGSQGRGQLRIPPLLSLTSLKTDEDGDRSYEVTWAATDYRLYPLAGPPWVRIEVDRVNGRYAFPEGQATVEITGDWGLYETAPEDVERAVILLAHRFANRAKTPEGVMGSQAEGYIRLGDCDPDVKAIAAFYMNPEAVFA